MTSSLRITLLLPLYVCLAAGQTSSTTPPTVSGSASSSASTSSGTSGSGSNDDSPAIEPVRTSITVAESIRAETPAFVSVLSRQKIRQQAGVSADDRLRSVPGFSLFRRASSVAANPTTQGVSLRGLGSSGASRTLVLWDSIPVNDPFGGWVYWTRLNPDEIDRVEVSRGASTSLFGDRAMSGTISLFSRPAEALRLTGSYEGGNRDTHILSGGFSNLWDKVGISGQVRGFTTDGYYIVQESRRGSVDRPAGVRFVAADTKLDFIGSEQRMFVKLDILAEERQNGTALTQNSTSLGTLGGHYTRQWGSNTLSALGYHTREVYRASFSSVAVSRNTEAITFLQRVPSEAVGAAGMWQHRADLWSLIGGVDTQRVEGVSTDRLAAGNLRVGGGSQWQAGTFLQGSATLGIVRLFAGGRQQFTSGDSRFFSPSGGIHIGRGWWQLRGTAYRAFRAPTLNELFRDFRAGNAETRSNPALRPETMTGYEVGGDATGIVGRFSASLFRHNLRQLITNVTISTTPQLISRQRQNAGAATTEGVEANWERLLFRYFRGELGYLYANSRFSTGERIPQVPRHSGMAQLTFVREGTLASMGLRSLASQFEDDRNQFLLPGFATFQIAARQRIAGGLSATLAVDNLTDREYAVGITAPAAAGLSPLVAIGTPRLWRVGLRWDGLLR